jgi:uncharacterized protein YgiB involved in biofilm formation
MSKKSSTDQSLSDDVPAGFLLGVCMHEKREPRLFKVQEYAKAKNQKTMVAKGKCSKCGYGMSKIVRKPEVDESVLNASAKSSTKNTKSSVLADALKEEEIDEILQEDKKNITRKTSI